MIKFFKNIPSLLKVIYFISKYQIITYPGSIKFPLFIRIIGSIFCLFFYPINLLKSPKDHFGVRLTNIFTSLGPIYIKFGQTLSTRPDLIGSEVAESLKYLQDKLPPFNMSIAKSRIEENFNRQISDIFFSFEDIPTAAASIAHVHKAEIKPKEAVAVKILRPNIHEKYDKDIKLLEFLANLTTKWIRKARRLKLNEVIALFRESMQFELNLRSEGAAASRISDSFTGDDSLYIPKIYWNFTTKEIITLEWIDGISIYDTNEMIKNNLNPKEIAAKIAIIFFNQAFRDGFFHADLHPGNILVRKNGSVALIDFGIIGILTAKDRFAVAEILHAFLAKDYIRVAKLHHKVGYIPQDTNLEHFALMCRAIAEPIMGLQIKDISIGNLLAQLFQVTEEFGMEMQPQLLLLQKTMVVIEGIGHSLDPDINMWQLAEPWIKKWAAKNITPEAKILRVLKAFFEKII